MNNKFKPFIYAIMGVLVGFIVMGLIRDGEIDWRQIGSFFTLLLIILLFKLGLNLYKKKS